MPTLIAIGYPDETTAAAAGAKWGMFWGLLFKDQERELQAALQGEQPLAPVS